MTFGLVWYRPEDWTALRSIFVDRDVLQDSYKEWQRDAERVERTMRAEGRAVRRVYLDPKTSPAWCALRQLRTDAAA